MESFNNHPNGDESGLNGEESQEDSMAPDCFPWPQDDTPDAKPDETLAAIDIVQEKLSQSPPKET
jgi:hypothetical protein